MVSAQRPHVAIQVARPLERGSVCFHGATFVTKKLALELGAGVGRRPHTMKPPKKLDARDHIRTGPEKSFLQL